MLKPIKTALISVYDKTNLELLLKSLNAHQVKIISTGGTGAKIKELGYEYTPIEQVTGTPECLGGRVKTLSYRISAGILADRDNAEHVQDLASKEIDQVDLVVCNLYPFKEMSQKYSNLSDLIEYIDIGGVTLLRAAAKNFKDVVCLNNPKYYQELDTQLKAHKGATSIEFRKKMALDCFETTANYDHLISQAFVEETELRYGENPHQSAKVIRNNDFPNLFSGTKIQGKEFSYNNYLDMNSSWLLISELNKILPDKKHVCVTKHNTPCGLASADDATRALELAWKGDSVSAFGSIIATNAEVDAEFVEFFATRFIEIIMAPSFTAQAKDMLAKKQNLRLYEIEPYATLEFEEERKLCGATLKQKYDGINDLNFECVTTEPFLDDQGLIEFSIVAGKHLKSNAIAVASKTKDGAYWMTGSGTGQPNRVDSFHLASKKFYQLKRSEEASLFSSTLLYSDAFFPFDDIVKLCSDVDLHYLVQPGGSIRDQEVIQTCDDLKLSMIFTGTRHFKH